MVGFLLLALATSSLQLRAQLTYDHTTFLNGFGSSSAIWTNSYNDLQATPPAYLSHRVVLQTPAYPNVDSLKRYSGQVSDITAYLTQGGHHVLVGHSLGSLVARGTYIDNAGIRPDVAAIIALTPPHQGVPIADNFVTLRSFLRDMQRRIDDAKTAIRIESFVTVNLLSLFIPGKRTTGLGPSIASFLFVNTHLSSIDVSNLDQVGAAPALADLSPDSAVIVHLNATYDDGAIPRANLYGTIPFRNAALRLLESARDNDVDFPNMVHTRDEAQMAFSACKWIGYVTIIQWTLGRRCAYARKTLGRLDDRWAKYVNGWDANGNPRYVPFDGIVPNERSRYPTVNGLAYDQHVDLINHINVYKTQAGLNKTEDAMLAVGMQPVNGNPPPTISVSISGSSSPTMGCPDVWWASASGGTGPYTYTWTVNGAPYETYGSGELEYTPTGPRLFLNATATDANGNSGTGSFSARPVQGSC